MGTDLCMSRRPWVKQQAGLHGCRQHQRKCKEDWLLLQQVNLQLELDILGITLLFCPLQDCPKAL